MADPATDVVHVALNSLHYELDAKMIPFAGYSMPVQYSTGIIAEHKHVRASAGLFDISHMGQFRIFGQQCGASKDTDGPNNDDVSGLLESIVPSKIRGLPLYKQRYTVLTNDAGGIIDDIIITNMGYYHSIVANASRKRDVYDYLNDYIGDKCSIYELSGYSLLAVQGPQASTVLKRFYRAPETSVLSLKNLNFMSSQVCIFEHESNSISCIVSRSGYTGEEGFEIAVPSRYVETVARAILEQPEVLPIGLGARDSLRLEAGLCLYGAELTKNITPVEAGLSWILRKDNTIPYPGNDIISKQLDDGPSKKRVGLQPECKSIVRGGTEILLEDKVVGMITSGAFSPILDSPIAMGYIESKYLADNSKFNIIVREHTYPIKIIDLPFITHTYY